MYFDAFCQSGIDHQVIGYDRPSNQTVGVVTGACSAVFMGTPSLTPTNNNNGNFSTIFQGDSNGINTFSAPAGGLYNTIINGNTNNIGGSPAVGVSLPASYSGIFGGLGNCIDTNTFTETQFATIVGGQGNNILTGADYAVIGGGAQNEIDVNSNCSFIGAGNGNYISGSGSFIGGGGYVVPFSPPAGNCIFSNFGFIGSGINNQINPLSDCSFISGGYLNNIGAVSGLGMGSVFSGIGGGAGNCIDDTGAATNANIIGGGNANTICQGTSSSSIFGGNGNYIASTLSFIGGGNAHQINPGSDCSFIGGGVQHRVGTPAGLGAAYSVISGGDGNTIDDTGAATSLGIIGGGSANFICSGTQWASIFSGHQNCVAANASFIGGGEFNTINPGSDCSFLGGGNSNNIYGIGSSVVGGQNHNAYSMFSFIGGGANNTVNPGSDGSFLGGGNVNNIGAVSGLGLGSIYSFIGAGAGNCIDDTSAKTSYGVIGGGQNNQLCSGTNYGTIAGGYCNIIGETMPPLFPANNYNFIGGGCCNSVAFATDSNTIAGGFCNCITGQNMYGGILGGICNIVTGGGAVVAGGLCNYSNGNGNVIAGGGADATLGTPGNTIVGEFSFIVGGSNNNVGLIGGIGASFSGIGGGQGNVIDDTCMTPTTYGIIGGGYQNCICAGTNFASIFNGNGNTVAGSCSSILGGANNNDNGNPFTGIYGTGVNGLPLAAGNGGFFVNEMVIQDIPVVTTAGGYLGLKPGEVYTCAPLGSGFLLSPLFIA